MSQAPPQLKEWAGELEQALEEFVNNESQIKKIVDKEMQEGQKVIKEEKHELDIEGEVEHDIGEIKEDLDELLNMLKNWENTISNNDQAQNSTALEGKVEEISGRDMTQIEQDIKEIKEDLGEIKEEEFNDEIPTIEVEATEVQTTYQAIVEADNEVSFIDEMANSLINTVNEHRNNTAPNSQDQEIIEIANAVEQLREQLENQLKQIENEQQEVIREISEEEDALWKEIKLDKEELEQLNTLIEEAGEEDHELQKLIKWAESQGNQYYLDFFEKVDDHLNRIHENLTSISDVVEEMEQALEQATEDLDEANPET